MVQPDADPIAGIPRLADFDDGSADPETVTDADFAVGETFHCKILTEIPEHEIRPPEMAGPVAVGIELVHQYRALLATMAAEIRLGRHHRDLAGGRRSVPSQASSRPPSGQYGLAMRRPGEVRH